MTWVGNTPGNEADSWQFWNAEEQSCLDSGQTHLQYDDWTYAFCSNPTNPYQQWGMQTYVSGQWT